jgi:alkylation response protein AidB-like acyl-CoA dehydrogenase
MSQPLVNRRDIDFNLYEVLDVESITENEFYEDHSKETFSLALDTAYQLAHEIMWPQFQPMDNEGVKLENGVTTVPEGMHDIWNALKDGGWIALPNEYDVGGQQFPMTIQLATALMFNAANTAATMYMGLTTGAAHLLGTFASEDLKEKYVLPMFSGEFAGTMALTEPQAGTSLSDIKTSATPVDGEDYHIIRGTKRFISSGDHNLTSNIIHPVLAKIEGSPAGVKGISLFLVPKYRLNEDGSVGEFNDVQTGGIEHKLGLKGQATAELKFGEKDQCRGWLVGNPNQGLNYMFQMMNGARLHTGLQAISQASAAYHCALQYTKEREQGREVTNRDPESPQIPIIKFPEIKRMLLMQKAYIEGSLALLMYCGQQSDVARVTEGKDEDAHHTALGILELLTPVCKAYVSDVAYESISTALQCYGGAGYIEEFPVAQMLRDSRVFPIYEGTNQIQAMDLLGRKIPAKGGAHVQTVMGEIGKTVAEASAQEDLKEYADKVQKAMEVLAETTLHLGGVGMKGDVDRYMSQAAPFLDAFSQVVVAWRLLSQAIVANRKIHEGSDDSFYLSKLATVKYYINAILPSTFTICEGIKNEADSAMDFEEAWF